MTNPLYLEMSDKVDIVLNRLMKAKQEIGVVKKDSKNPFHKSNYASLNAYIDASEEHLLNNGLILVQAGNGNYNEPMMVSTLIHPESGQWLKSYFPILNPKADSQGLGASVTYMRRYSISTLLGLVSEDDDGETAVGRGKYDQQKKTKPIKCEIVSSEEIIKTEAVEDDKEYIKSYLSQFDKDDKHLAMTYLKIVRTHFDWTNIQTITELLKDEKKLFDKFNTWKNKQAKQE